MNFALYNSLSFIVYPIMTPVYHFSIAHAVSHSDANGTVDAAY